MNIITLTLNPAFDVHCHTEQFFPFHENLAHITARDAGGKGVNISRALANYGINNNAVLVLGEENADEFLSKLPQIPYRAITVPGRIRENITLHSDNDRETRISFGGFRAPENLSDEIENILQEWMSSDTVITVTGRNTDGLSMDRIKTMLRRLTEMGAKLVIDSRSFSLADLKELRPWLIKPNQEEISQYLGRTIDSFEETLSSALDLHQSGISNVMISMGDKGALLVCSDGIFTAVPPEITVRSTIGAGDSSIAGFLAAASKKASSAECLQLAVAFGSAACLTEGSLPPQTEQIKKIYQAVSVSKLG